MKANSLFSVLAVALMLITQTDASHSPASSSDLYRNSDEDRFYIDESNWDMLHKELDRRQSRHQAAETLSSADQSYENVTVKVGRKAVLPCFVSNLGSFKVIWAKQGDILALGTTKINSDARLSVQHRYMSEWHLVIENVAADDQGEYICKTNGDFYKLVRLQVLMPPTMDDSSSVPAGTINLAEGSTLSLKCHAEGNPEPEVKWYRWKRLSSGVESAKEELPSAGNELAVSGMERHAANMYECIARNSVPPATSRVFSVHVHFLPKVALSVHNQQQLLLHRQFSLSCQISANPLERVLWYKDGQLLSGDHYQVSEARDHSDLEHLYRHLGSLTVPNARVSDFGSYQCCAMNAYGQVCSSVQVAGHQRHHKDSKDSKAKQQQHASKQPQATTSTAIDQIATTRREDRDKDLILDSISRALATSTASSSSSSSRNETEQEAKRRQQFLNSKQFRYQAGSDSPANSASLALLALCALLACVRSL